MESSFYKQQIEHASMGFAYHEIMCDAEGKPCDYKLLELNPAFANLVGVKAKDVIGKTITQISLGTAQDKLNWIRQFGEIALVGGSKEFGWFSQNSRRLFRLNVFSVEKNYFTVFVCEISIQNLESFNPIDLGSKSDIDDGVLGLLTGIEETQKIRKEAEKKEKILVEAQRIAHIGSYELDFVKGIWQSSEELERIFGIDTNYPKTIVGWLYLVHPDWQVKMQKYLTDIIANKESFDCTYKIVQVNSGQERWVHGFGEITYDDQDNPLTLIGCIQDITENKGLELLLQESQKHLQRAIDEAPVPIMLHAEDGEVIRISKAWTKMTGYGIADIPTTQIWTEKAFGLQRHEVQSFMDTLYHLESQHNDGIFTIATKDGDTQFWDFYSASIGKLNDGRRLAMSIAINITEKRIAAEQLRLANEAAEAAAIAKSQFLSNMSHEIRTPLNGVMGVIQILSMTDLSEEQTELINIAKVSSDLLLDIISDILDFSKIEIGKFELENRKFSLRNFIKETSLLYRSSMQSKDLDFEITVDENIPDSLNGDFFRLRQVLSNLIGNAIKFTNEGKIDMAVRKIRETSSNEIVLEFLVKDTGIGIKKDKMDSIFQSFTQVDGSSTRQFGGVGLGLSICKGLLTYMDGDIWATSQEDVGSEFYFTCALEVSPDDGFYLE